MPRGQPDREPTHVSRRARLVPDPAAAAALVVDAVRVLHANGAESARTQARADQLASTLGTTADLDLGWNRSTVTVGPETDQPTVVRFRTTPSTLGMNRVLAVDEAINGLADDTLTEDQTHQAVRSAAALPPCDVAVFVLACAAGAASLAVIFGVSRWQPVAVIVVSAAIGALLRRGLARLGASNFWQVGAAALVAGLLGAAAVHAGLSSDLRLAVLCPCLILVPGPHLLNGSFDLVASRIPLGLARLTFAAVTLLATGAGVLAGLTLGGAELVTDPGSRAVPLWLDVAAAGVVAVCYGVFYSAPARILYWPLLIGGGAHGLRWIALTQWHWQPHLAAALACLLVGVVLVPVSRRFQVPFAAVGFAAVVSLLPGVLIFRALSGLTQLQDATGQRAQQLLTDTVNDANQAALTVFAMAIGLIVPIAVYHHIATHRTPSS